MLSKHTRLGHVKLALGIDRIAAEVDRTLDAFDGIVQLTEHDVVEDGLFTDLLTQGDVSSAKQTPVAYLEQEGSVHVAGGEGTTQYLVLL